MATSTHAADHRSQAKTLPLAIEHRAEWTTADLEFVAEFSADRDEDIALALGRSLYAIRAIRTVLEDRMTKARRRRIGAPPSQTLAITSWTEWEAQFDA